MDGQIAGQDGTDLVTNGSFSGVSDGTDVASLTGWDAYGSVTSRNITSEQLVLVTTAANTGAVINCNNSGWSSISRYSRYFR